MRFSLMAAATAMLAAAGAAPAQARDADGQPYFVQPGDSLSRISVKFYEDPLSYPSIMAATNDMARRDRSYAPVHDVNTIHVGDKLWIPVAAELKATDARGRGVAHMPAHGENHDAGHDSGHGATTHRAKTLAGGHIRISGGGLGGGRESGLGQIHGATHGGGYRASHTPQLSAGYQSERKYLNGH